MEGGNTSSLNLNLTDPCRPVLCQYHSWGMPGRRAGSSIAVYTPVQCRDPKQGRKRFNNIVKTIHSPYLPIVYLWLAVYIHALPVCLYNCRQSMGGERLCEASLKTTGGRGGGGLRSVFRGYTYTLYSILRVFFILTCCAYKISTVQYSCRPLPPRSPSKTVGCWAVKSWF